MLPFLFLCWSRLREIVKNDKFHSPQVDADTSPTSVDGKLGHGHETGHHHQIQELEETPGQTVADLNNRGRQR